MHLFLFLIFPVCGLFHIILLYLLHLFICLLYVFMHTNVGSRDEIQVVMLPLHTERTILLALAFLFFKK